MNARFLKWFEWVIKWEGTAYENVPGDRGGPTKFGIDQRSHPDVDIKNITWQQAAKIYHADYWTKVRAEELPAGVGEIVADIAVNNGRGRAIPWLQAAIGVKADGAIGPLTIAAANKGSAKALGKTLLDRRESFYRSIGTGTQAKFLKGWLNRNNDARKVWNA